MTSERPEEVRLRSAALQTMQSIQIARQKAEEELLRAKEQLERQTADLARSLALLSATLEATTDAILVTDASRHVTGYNARFVALWDLPPEVLATRDHQRIVAHVSSKFAAPADFVARVDEIYASRPAETQDLLETADGRSIERSSRLQLVGEREVGRVWSFRDTTERRRLEHVLREESRMLELLNEAGSAIASQLDLRSVLQNVTDAATKLSGASFGAFFYNVTKPEGESFLLYTLSGAPRAAFDKFGLPRNTPLFEPTFRGREILRFDDVTADPRYGRMAPHFGMPRGHLPVRSYLAVPVRLRDGTVIGGLFFGHPEVGVFHERTERLVAGIAGFAAIAVDNARLYEDVKRLADEREALLDAERAARGEAQRINLLKDEFLANVSHELRTPLNAILGWSQLIAAGGLGAADLKQGVETIARNARAQAHLIEDLLDMSRIISGKVRLDVQETDLASVVQQALNTVRPSAEAKGIQLRSILDPRVGPVSGDPNRLQQVVWNLLSNAVKFTPKGGRVDVLLQRVNSHVEVTVRDTGIGIAPEFLPHLFERFRQGDSSTTRTHGGLGLGLSIVKQLVELHGGSVRAHSGGEGQGSTFTVNLPLAPLREGSAREHPRTSAAAPVEMRGLDLTGVRVLVVDDEPDARELIKRVLAQRGAEVVTASGATEAMARLGTAPVDVLVSDIGMPETDGYQFIRQVRRAEAPGGRRLPAIALTAFARSEDRTRTLMAGYQMHLAKPIEPQELLVTVASFAGRTARHAEPGPKESP